MLRSAPFLLVLLCATGCDKSPGAPTPPGPGIVNVPVHFQDAFSRDRVTLSFEGEEVYQATMSTLATGLADAYALRADEDGGDQLVEVRVDTVGAEESVIGAVRFDPAEDAAVVVRFRRYDSASSTPASLSLTPVAELPTYGG